VAESRQDYGRRAAFVDDAVARHRFAVLFAEQQCGDPVGTS
jgi:hypothetical protein